MCMSRSYQITNILQIMKIIRKIKCIARQLLKPTVRGDGIMMMMMGGRGHQRDQAANKVGIQQTLQRDRHTVTSAREYLGPRNIQIT